MVSSDTWIFLSGGDNLQQIMEYDTNHKIIYQGWAQAGIATSITGWRIRNFTYNVDDLTNIKFPSGSPAFAFVWDDRATYTYS